ncbi:hypothetical protein OROHE_007818 [Orobanche hederae]
MQVFSAIELSPDPTGPGKKNKAGKNGNDSGNVTNGSNVDGNGCCGADSAEAVE